MAGELLTTQAPESHTPTKRPGANAGRSHLKPEQIVDVLRWDAQGLTQEQIAARFNPPKDQATISRCLAKYGTDTTTEAKRIFAAQAAPAAIKIMREGRPSDLIKVQEGQGVLAQSLASGLVIQIGCKDSDVRITLSPPGIEGGGRKVEESLAITSGSDNPSSVNQSCLAPSTT
jgi:hypothetical protein